MMFRRVLIQADDFNVGAETALASGNGLNTGASVTFVGLCRDEMGSLDALDIECYEEMALLELNNIIDSAAKRWKLEAMTVIHRCGRILAGERIVLVIAAGRHRSDAFAAAEFTMDFLKQQAPFWKRNVGKVGGQANDDWVSTKMADADAAARWDSL